MIKVGFLISYDFEYVFLSIQQVYDYVDQIFLAIDSNRRTWVGNQFDLPASFFAQLGKIDVDKKIICYEDDFFVPSNSPMENETRERRMLAERMGSGWCVQLDADEYIYDFASVAQFLRKNQYLTKRPERTPVSFQGTLITLFKMVDDGILYIDNGERFEFITNAPSYTSARHNKKVPSYFSNIQVIHQSWARPEQEIRQKIGNWGHRFDFDTDKFFAFWKQLDSTNYREVKNFHPLVPHFWNELKFLPVKSATEMVREFNEKKRQAVRGIPGLRSSIFKLKAL